jgi:hypothetical protein
MPPAKRAINLANLGKNRMLIDPDRRAKMAALAAAVN